MKTTLAAGIAAKRQFHIDRERTIDCMGEAARVYATPMLARDSGVACRGSLREHLDAGEDSVGTRVEIDHLAAHAGIALRQRVYFQQQDQPHDLIAEEFPYPRRVGENDIALQGFKFIFRDAHLGKRAEAGAAEPQSFAARHGGGE